jgi:uncharacterized protein (DUF342 family)
MTMENLPPNFAQNVQDTIAKVAAAQGVMQKLIEANQSTNNADHLQIRADMQTISDSLVSLGNQLAAIDLTGVINDSATSATDTVLSAAKTMQEIEAAVARVVGAAPPELDTIKEVIDLVHQDEAGLQRIVDALVNYVRTDAPQAFSPEAQAMARSNIGSAAASDMASLAVTVNTLSNGLGDTTVNLATVYDAAYAAAYAAA